LTPAVLHENVKMQIQFLDPRMAYGLSNQAACLCTLLKLTRQCSAPSLSQPACQQSTPIQAFIASAFTIFLHPATFCYPVCYPVGALYTADGPFLKLLGRQKRQSRTCARRVPILVSRRPPKRNTSCRVFGRRIDWCALAWIDWHSRGLSVRVVSVATEFMRASSSTGSAAT